jgi:hypothetical protein
MSCVDPLDWFSEECYWSGLNEAQSGMREDYRGAVRDINGDSPFTQPLLLLEAWRGRLLSSAATGLPALSLVRRQSL